MVKKAIFQTEERGRPRQELKARCMSVVGQAGKKLTQQFFK